MAPTIVTHLLFVYGTLRRQVRPRLLRQLAPDAEFVGTARTRGRLYDLGSFPGLVPSEIGGDWVQGGLHALVGSALSRIDRHEGCGANDPLPHVFERVRVPVFRTSSEEVEAWAYAYTGPTRGRPLIRSGDYAAWTRLGLGP